MGWGLGKSEATPFCGPQGSTHNWHPPTALWPLGEEEAQYLGDPHGMTARGEALHPGTSEQGPGSPVDKGNMVREEVKNATSPLLPETQALFLQLGRRIRLSEVGIASLGPRPVILQLCFHHWTAFQVASHSDWITCPRPGGGTSPPLSYP